jgi:hypothetical protein
MQNQEKEQHNAAVTFFHPDYYRRPRSFTGSCSLLYSLGLAGYTAGQELAYC